MRTILRTIEGEKVDSLLPGEKLNIRKSFDITKHIPILPQNALNTEELCILQEAKRRADHSARLLLLSLLLPGNAYLRAHTVSRPSGDLTVNSMVVFAYCCSAGT